MSFNVCNIKYGDLAFLTKIYRNMKTLQSTILGFKQQQQQQHRHEGT